MSWSIEEHIGEGRPWPAQVVVYRGETSECLAYVSGEVADRLQAENAKLQGLLAEVLMRLFHADLAAGGGFIDARFIERIKRECGIEAGE